MWHALYMKWMKLAVKYFFLADVLFLEGSLRLESSCIQVNMVLFVAKEVYHSVAQCYAV
jgi:hypothetical protein